MTTKECIEKQACPTCKGTGEIEKMDKNLVCPNCIGSGKTKIHYMKWIKCSERFPEKNQRVIVWDYMRNKWYEDKCIISDNNQPHWYNSPSYAITHWFLPEPPDKN